MPKTNHARLTSPGGWTYLRPMVEKMARTWPRPLDRSALNEQFLGGVLVFAARDPKKLSDSGWQKFRDVYTREPDWILAVLQLYRREIVSPRSPRKALHALLHADWMHTAKDEKVIAELRKEFPSLAIPKGFSGGNVSNARSTVRASLKKRAKT